MGKNQLKIEVKLIVRERVEAGGEPDREAEGGKESDIETGEAEPERSKEKYRERKPWGETERGRDGRYTGLGRRQHKTSVLSVKLFRLQVYSNRQLVHTIVGCP